MNIEVAPHFMGKMEGLCGNYDNSVTNEFMTPQGSTEILESEFVNSWKLLSCEGKTENDLGLSPCEVGFVVLGTYLK